MADLGTLPPPCEPIGAGLLEDNRSPRAELLRLISLTITSVSKAVRGCLVPVEQAYLLAEQRSRQIAESCFPFQATVSAVPCFIAEVKGPRAQSYCPVSISSLV